jgi:hypothetical protein
MKHKGRHWGRSWEATEDVSEQLVDGRVRTALECAFASACMDVEAGSEELASAKVRKTPNGMWKVSATCCGKLAHRVTSRCASCGADVMPGGSDHPMNGCIEVAVQEVMEI